MDKLPEYLPPGPRWHQVKSGMLQAVVFRAVCFGLAWWALTGDASKTWALGVIVVALTVAASIYLMPPGGGVALRALPGFIAFFVQNSIRGGAQVALMAIRPRPALSPAMLEMTLRLPDETSRVFLACTLNLLPGTLSAGLDGDRLVLHVLNRDMPIEAEVRSAEERIARLLRMELR